MTKLKVLTLCTLACLFASCQKNAVSIITSPTASKRLQFGTEQLKTTLENDGYTVKVRNLNDAKHLSGKTIFALEKGDPVSLDLAKKYGFMLPDFNKKEGFYIGTKKNKIGRAHV